MLFNRIITALRKTVQQNYDKIFDENNHSEYGVLIIHRTLHTRKISDWGRDEDTDELIYLNKNGWTAITKEIQYGAGPSKIISENKKDRDDKYVYELLNKDDNLTTSEFLDFIDRFHEIKEKYRSDFSHNLY